MINIFLRILIHLIITEKDQHNKCDILTCQAVLGYFRPSNFGVFGLGQPSTHSWKEPGACMGFPITTTDLNVSTAKQEIANCVLAAVYIPMELWGSFYH